MLVSRAPASPIFALDLARLIGQVCQVPALQVGFRGRDSRRPGRSSAEPRIGVPSKAPSRSVSLRIPALIPSVLDTLANASRRPSLACYPACRSPRCRRCFSAFRPLPRQSACRRWSPATGPCCCRGWRVALRVCDRERGPHGDCPAESARTRPVPRKTPPSVSCAWAGKKRPCSDFNSSVPEPYLISAVASSIGTPANTSLAPGPCPRPCRLRDRLAGRWAPTL